jgi:U3 small nucleolar RNA-associated protein 4
VTVVFSAHKILIYQGLDTNLVVMPITGFWAEHKREISSLPQLPRVASAPSTRLVMSWWNQEVNIWRLERPHGHKKDKIHKLVARIGLQGDENITDAAISADGSVLAVSTMANTRIFQLSRRKNDLDGGLKVRKIESEIPLPGSRLLQLSQSGHWLSIVDKSSHVNVIRLVLDTNSELLRVLPALIELEIPSRETKDERPTALDSYIHTITRLQFSPDGKLLVASDLSGYINSWIIEGHEDFTAAEVDAPENDDNKSSSSSEDDEEERPTVILGQHWKHNDATKLLPKLKSAPIILSFRPQKVRSPKPEPNGNPAVHATRHNPHPIAHDRPEGLYELLVLTSQHELYEFDLLEGRLTEWSKRNPTSLLPAQFQKIRDRAMGNMWHTSGKLQRWWLYGSNWMFMLDLSQDFAEAKQEPHLEHTIIPETKKRKREDESGAGGKKARYELEGLEPKVDKYVNGKRVGAVEKENKSPLLFNGFAKEEDSDEEDDEDDGLGGVFNRDEIKPQRRRYGKLGPPASWCSFGYRSILGMVDIGSTDGCLETVIVERPVFDLDLPPRLVGPNDR